MEDQGNKKELTLTRIFNIPKQVLWEYWTDPVLISKWWGPEGFTTPISQLDVRPGGKIYLVMEDSQGLIKKGSRYPMTGVFQEVTKPEKIVYTSSAIMNDKPILENLVIVVFAEQDEKTKMTVRIVVTKTTSEAEMPLQGMEMGWNQSLDKLKNLLEKT